MHFDAYLFGEDTATDVELHTYSLDTISSYKKYGSDAAIPKQESPHIEKQKIQYVVIPL